MLQLRMDRRLHGRIDASDVLQDAYLDAARRLDEYLADPSLAFYQRWASFRQLNLNRLAWLLVTAPKEFRNPEKALQYAREAVQLASDNAGYLNTLGIVQYRLDDWSAAIETLEQAVRIAGDEKATAYDFLFLSMSFSQLGKLEKARANLEKGIQWIDEQKSLSPQWKKELTETRQEAQDLIASLTEP